MPVAPQLPEAVNRGWWIPAALLAFAVTTVVVRFPFSSPVSEARPTPSWAADPTPVRQPHLQPEYRQAGFSYRCSECHKIIASPAETHRTLTQHRELHLEHGINTRCFNCHHRDNRDAFADDYGNEIPWDQPHLVCAKCHGPVYRDWQHGSHGRTHGSWNAASGMQQRLKCVQCHDPHRPAFQSLAPAPGPNTLRMGAGRSQPHEAEHDPLRLQGRSHGEHAPQENR